MPYDNCSRSFSRPAKSGNKQISSVEQTVEVVWIRKHPLVKLAAPSGLLTTKDARSQSTFHLLSYLAELQFNYH